MDGRPVPQSVVMDDASELGTAETRLPGSRLTPGSRTSGFRERQHHAVGVDANRVARAELAGQDAIGQRILQLLLDRALQRARAVHRVEADVAEQRQRARR